ncbi:MAG: 30S ribosomal protein S4 [Bacillota bacterium]
MARNTQPIMKRCKSLGIEPADMGYFGKKTNRKPKISKKKPSEYSLQLKEKQKVKFIYGLLEKQFHHYYEMADKMKGITGENMLSLIERRLDNTCYRMGVGTTRAMSRQLVAHGHITVNGSRVDIPSYLVKAGDVIEIKDNKKDNGVFKLMKTAKKSNQPKWVSFDNETLKGKVLALPERSDVDAIIAEHMIVEFYSK